MRFQFELRQGVKALEVGFSIRTGEDVTLQTFLGHWEHLPTQYERGIHCVECEIPSVNLFPGSYVIRPWIKRHSEGVDDQVLHGLEFSVVGANVGGAAEDLERYPKAGVFQRSTWTTRVVTAGAVSDLETRASA